MAVNGFDTNSKLNRNLRTIISITTFKHASMTAIKKLKRIFIHFPNGNIYFWENLINIFATNVVTIFIPAVRNYISVEYLPWVTISVPKKFLKEIFPKKFLKETNQYQIRLRKMLQAWNFADFDISGKTLRVLQDPFHRFSTKHLNLLSHSNFLTQNHEEFLIGHQLFPFKFESWMQILQSTSYANQQISLCFLSFKEIFLQKIWKKCGEIFQHRNCTIKWWFSFN